MSRGPGKIQQTILQAIQASAEPIQRNQLLWEIAAQFDLINVTGQITKTIKTGKIVDSFLKSYQRAIKTLTDSDKIKVTKKKFGDIDEFIEYYPYKTTSLEIKMLRKELLPLIKPFHPAFTIASNETHILENIEQEYPRRFKKYAVYWREFERRILLQLPTKKQNITDNWLSLITKGRQLFLDRHITNTKAFHTIINDIDGTRDQLDEALSRLLKEIAAFQKKVWKPKVMAHNRFKSQLCAVANFSRRVIPRWTDETKHYFLQQKPQIIESLPGHQKSMRKGWHRTEEEFDPILDTLIHRNVFSKFEYLGPMET